MDSLAQMVEHNEVGVHIEDVVGIRWILVLRVVGRQWNVLIKHNILRLRLIIH